MLLKKSAIRGKNIVKKSDCIKSIEYIFNQKTLRNFNNQKRLFKKCGKVNDERKVREILLFHGTDSDNIDGILKNNFDIDTVPIHKNKRMAYGRGVYMSEHPEISFKYGNILQLCKVILPVFCAKLMSGFILVFPYQ